nr:MAG TPA: hypothetical protein [Caudoviricetes sp.]
MRRFTISPNNFAPSAYSRRGLPQRSNNDTWPILY